MGTRNGLVACVCGIIHLTVCVCRKRLRACNTTNFRLRAPSVFSCYVYAGCRATTRAHCRPIPVRIPSRPANWNGLLPTTAAVPSSDKTSGSAQANDTATATHQPTFCIKLSHDNTFDYKKKRQLHLLPITVGESCKREHSLFGWFDSLITSLFCLVMTIDTSQRT